VHLKITVHHHVHKAFLITLYHDAQSSECQKGKDPCLFSFTMTLLYLTWLICKSLSLSIWLIFLHYYILEFIFLLHLVISFFFFLFLFCLFCGIRFLFNLVRVQFQEFIQSFISLSLFHYAFASTFSCFYHFTFQRIYLIRVT
jgi:hypothetical protein